MRPTPIWFWHIIFILPLLPCRFFTDVMFHGGTCTGTGMGGNQVLPFCQGKAEWLIPVLSVVDLGLLLFVTYGVHQLRLQPAYKAVILVVVFIGWWVFVAFTSAFVWNWFGYFSAPAT